MKQKETIIYGGAFNPPTRAHQTILQVCADRAGQSGADVWLLPSGERRDKCIDANRERRLQLCAALCLDIVTTGETLLRVEEQELDRIKHILIVSLHGCLGLTLYRRCRNGRMGLGCLKTCRWLLLNVQVILPCN